MPRSPAPAPPLLAASAASRLSHQARYSERPTGLNLQDQKHSFRMERLWLQSALRAQGGRRAAAGAARVPAGHAVSVRINSVPRAKTQELLPAGVRAMAFFPSCIHSRKSYTTLLATMTYTLKCATKSHEIIYRDCRLPWLPRAAVGSSMHACERVAAAPSALAHV